MDQPLGSRYRIGELLGRGGMGSVHRGQGVDGTPYAIKMLRPELAGDPDVVTRFVRERTVLTGVRHPHLVAVHDLVVEGDTLAIVMDLVEGPDLRQALREQGVFPPAEVARIGAGVAAALAAAHGRGLLHRDVKPANVLFDTTSDPPMVRLADFGIARLVGDSRLSQVTGLIGTPDYLPPEVLAGEPAVAAGDLYALGVLLYELSCGVPPFVGDVVAVMAGHVSLVPGRPPGLPDPLWNLIEKLLEKNPAHRPRDAGAAADTLMGLSASLTGLAPAPRLDRPMPGAPTGLPWREGRRPAGAGGGRASGGTGESRFPRRPMPTLVVLLAVAVAGALGAGATWLALDEERAGVPAAGPCDSAAVSAGCGSPEQVRRVQERLLDLCYFVDNGSRSANTDGRFGPATETALQRFQIVNDLQPVDGAVGPGTAAALFDPTARPDPQAFPCDVGAQAPGPTPAS